MELLIAMAILSIILVSLHAALSTCLRVHARCRDALGRLQADRTLISMLHDDLCNLSPFSPNLAIDIEGLALVRGSPPSIRAGNDNRTELVRYHWVQSSSLAPSRTSEPRRRIGAQGEDVRRNFTREEMLLPQAFLEHLAPKVLLRLCLEQDSLDSIEMIRRADPGAPVALLDQLATSRGALQVFGDIRSFSLVPLILRAQGLVVGDGGAQDSLVALQIRIARDSPSLAASQIPNAPENRSMSDRGSLRGLTPEASSAQEVDGSQTGSALALFVPAARHVLQSRELSTALENRRAQDPHVEWSAR